MTPPFERTRSLIETKKLLRDLLNPRATPRVPAAIRRRAAELFDSFPSYSDLQFVHEALPDLFEPVPPFRRLVDNPETPGIVKVTKQTR